MADKQRLEIPLLRVLSASQANRRELKSGSWQEGRVGQRIAQAQTTLLADRTGGEPRKSHRPWLKRFVQAEIVPSGFDELLPHGDFAEDLAQYPVATATEKALEVYRRLIDDDRPPDVVIGADSVILHDNRILEKPGTQDENLRMLRDLNAGVHEVVTGIAVIVPRIQSPGYEVKSLFERTRVFFHDHPLPLLETYAATGEGWDRAGGYAIQEMGALLVQRIEGDYANVVGLPISAFVRWLSDALEHDELFEED